jgi:hypothetical protein
MTTPEARLRGWHQVVPGRNDAMRNYFRQAGVKGFSRRGLVVADGLKQSNPDCLRGKWPFIIALDYGIGHQVCKLEVPAVMPSDSQVKNGAEMKQTMYAFLADLVPEMRATEMRRGVIFLGAISFSTVEYEHVMIVEVKYDNQPFDSSYNKITVRFTNPACQQPAAH